MRIHLKINFFLLLLAALLAHGGTPGLAQTAPSVAKVRGQAVDGKNAPAPFATLVLLAAADSALVKGAVSDETGYFAFEGVPTGRYLVKASMIGAKTVFSNVIEVLPGNPEIVLPAIALHEEVNALAEVKVVAAKNLIELENDKIIFNVASSINAAGTNALEALRKAPGVTVDLNDVVSLKGRSGVKIMINGKLSPLSDADVAAMLKSIPSDQIQAIEIIGNPSARYDAAGNAGMINIVLKKNQSLGTNGSVNGSGTYGITPKYTAGANLNYRTDKLNLFSNYGYTTGAYQTDFIYKRVQNDQAGLPVNYDQESTNINDSRRNSFKAGADYFLNRNNTIGFLVDGNFGNSSDNVDSRTNIYRQSGPIDSVLLARNAQTTRWGNYNVNLNYHYADTSGRVVNLDADYGLFSRRADSYQPNAYFPGFAAGEQQQSLSERIYQNDAPSTVRLQMVKGDYEQPLWKGKLSTGFKLSAVRSENDFNFYNVTDGIAVTDITRTNRFDYREAIYAGYLNYNRNFNKWSVQAGLRAEQTQSEGNLTALVPVDNGNVKRSYMNLFPSAAVSYKPNDNHSFGANYSRRVGRPTYQDLNPFEFRLDELTFVKGNPFLRPQFTQSFQLNYARGQLLVASVGYSRTNDVFAPVIDTTEANRIRFMVRNIAVSHNYNLSLSSSFSVRPWWNSSINTFLYRAVYRGQLEEDFLNNSIVTLVLNTQQRFSLPKGFAAEVSVFARTPEVYGTFRNQAVGSVDLGLQKSLMQDNATLRFTVSDVFYTLRLKGTVRFNGLDLQTSQLPETRVARLSFTYRLGSNQVKEQRNRSTGSEEERSRVRN